MCPLEKIKENEETTSRYSISGRKSLGHAWPSSMVGFFVCLLTCIRPYHAVRTMTMCLDSPQIKPKRAGDDVVLQWSGFIAQFKADE